MAVIPPVETPFAICLECEFHQLESISDLRCPHCAGQMMTRFADLSKASQASFRAQAWFRSLRRLGLQGYSPGGASQKLKCSRSMIEKLAAMGVLEKSVYDRDGILQVFISERSIQRALEAKRTTGMWTKAGEVE